MPYRHTYVFADGVTQNPSGTPVIPYPLITANGNYPSDMGFLFQGGSGQLAVGGTLGGGTFQLQQRLPDQITWVNVPGAVTTSVGLISFAAAESSRLRLAVSGATAPSASAFILDLPEGTSFAPVASGSGGSVGPTGGQQVEGTQAVGTATTANPVSVSYQVRNQTPSQAIGNSVIPRCEPTGMQYMALGTSNSANFALVNAANTATVSPNTTVLYTGTFQYIFDGSNWLRSPGDAVAPFAKQPPLNKADRSVTASTTSAQAAAANATRAKLVISNLDSTNAVFINLGAAATTGAGSMRIGPLGFLELQGTNQAVNVVAAAGTPAVTIWEF